jgi:hypothetical protein
VIDSVLKGRVVECGCSGVMDSVVEIGALNDCRTILSPNKWEQFSTGRCMILVDFNVEIKKNKGYRSTCSLSQSDETLLVTKRLFLVRTLYCFCIASPAQ